MSIDKRWVTTLSGKEFVTFPGLLDLAHQKGLCGIETELIQTPSAENEQSAVVRATCRFRVDGSFIDTWTGIGDASPKNVNRMIATALIRMAETRAIGRALRMACNVGQTMAEELEEGTAPVPEGRSAAETGGNGQAPQTATSQSAKAPAKPSVADQKVSAPICEGCGKPVRATIKRDGSERPADEVAELSKRTFGQVLCDLCVREAQAMGKANLPSEAVAA